MNKNRKYTLGIDAFNIRAGGGVTYLVELLRAAEPSSQSFDRVIIWGGAETLSKIEERDWLQKVHEPCLDRALPYRLFWQRFKLKRLAERAGCDVLFVPGGSDVSGFEPIVTMSLNLLPFEGREILRFGWSLFTIKYLLLRRSQSCSFRKADGVIFLTKYANDTVLKITGPLRGDRAIIPFGINPRFFQYPRLQRLPAEFSGASPCRLLYVSIIDPYKHQWKVVEAAEQLRSEGLPIILDLVGPPGQGMIRLNETLKRADPEGRLVNYRGAVPYERLDSIYGLADIGIFASSCENMPNILLECMAAGLPMACSNMGPMPEILGAGGAYFCPEDSNDIARALRLLFESPDLRRKMAQAAFDRAKALSWKDCANETLRFLGKISVKSIERE